MKQRTRTSRLAYVALSAAILGSTAVALQTTGALAAGSGDSADFSMTNVRGDDGQLGHQREVKDYHFVVNAQCVTGDTRRTCRPLFKPVTVNFASIGPGTIDLLNALTTGQSRPLAELDVNPGGSYCGFQFHQCLKYCLYNVLVTNVTHDGNQSSPEAATLDYDRIAYIYEDVGDGGTSRATGGWDIARRRGFTASSC